MNCSPHSFLQSPFSIKYGPVTTHNVAVNTASMWRLCVEQPTISAARATTTNELNTTSLRFPHSATLSRIRLTVNVGSGTVWWGEATDEPARADARPTENANCTTTSPSISSLRSRRIDCLICVA